MEANWSVHISEAAAASFALDIARRMGYDYVHLEGDSLTVINAISVQESGSNHIYLFLDKIAETISCFAGFTCSFVHRLGNTVVHMVARCDTGNATEKICMESFLPSLQTLVDLDNISYRYSLKNKKKLPPFLF